MFRLLRVKPPNGWNAVVWELAIVVLGVLIALGAQQVVEEWEWRKKVGIVRNSLMGELANDRGRWEYNMKAVPCTLRDIKTLQRWAEQGGSDPAPQTQWLGSVPIFWMHSANWELATSSQTLDHFPLKEQLDFAALYDGVLHRQVDLEKATDLYEQVLYLLPLADDAESRRDLRTTLGKLEMKITALAVNDDYMRRRFDAVGVKPDTSDFSADISGPGCPK